MAIKTANNQSMTAITSLPSGVSAQSLILLATNTIASSASTSTFDSSIDDTYKEYVFKFIDIHGSYDDTFFQVNFRDGSTAYDATKTSTIFRAYHFEDGTGSALQYQSEHDVAQGTGVVKLNQGCGNDNDMCTAGYLHLFNPSSTTYVKHFLARTTTIHASDRSYEWYVAGYCNVTAAIDGVQFSFADGTIDSGTIKMYGVV